MTGASHQSRRTRAHSGFALEPLEERQLLTAYVGQNVGEYFNVPLIPWLTIAGSNEALTFAYNNEGEGVAVVNGEYTTYSRIPGMLAFDEVLGVNDSALIALRAGTRRYLVRDGVRTALDEAVAEVDAPAGMVPDYDGMNVVEVNNSGSILLWEQTDSTPASGRGWLYRDGRLTFLFDGKPSDINGAGDVVGTAGLRRADGSMVTLTGMSPKRIIDTGVVFGTDMSGNDFFVLRWQDGVLSVLSSKPRGGLLDNFRATEYEILDANNGERLLLRYTGVNLPAGPGFRRWFTYDPVDGTMPLEEVTYDYAHRVGGTSLTEDGTIISDTTIILLPIPEDQARIVLDGSPVSITWSGDGAAAIAINSFGDAVLLTRSDQRWKGRRVEDLSWELSGGGALHPPDDIVVLPNPTGASGLPTVFLIAAGRLLRLTPGPEGGYTLRELARGFAGRLAAFQSSDSRAHVAAVNTEAELVLFFETKPGGAWVSSNLTTDHIQAAGKTFVPVAGDMTAFATPWGGMNIAYLDSQGHVQTVWWSPPLAHWTIDDLSANAGARAPLHGGLVSMVTPWGGLNVVGTDPGGALIALWWAPGLTEWRTDRLVEGAPAQLDENTITAYVTPWGGLNVAGLDKTTGKLTAYWWAPGKPAWVVEEFKIKNAPADVALDGRLSSAVSPDGRMFIAARTGENHLANIWIGPETGFEWTFEDVTMAV